MKTGEADFPPEDDPVEAMAASWLVEREEGFTPAQAGEFERWRQLHPRHAAAVARLEAACFQLERLPLVASALRAEVAPRAPAGEANAREGENERRPLHAFRFIPLGIAAAMAFAALAWWRWPAAIPAAQYATSSGGYERVKLADDSILELNANSRAQVQFSAQERSVTLNAGEAHFSVAHDTTRPFVVRAGNVSVRAVGTAFNVRLVSGAVEVLVTEGKVSVVPNGEGTAPARPVAAVAAPVPPNPLVQAGERVIVPLHAAAPAPQVEQVDPTAIRQALAWQERMLWFADSPLREVAAQFNRRNRTQLVLGDAALAERPVGGTFAADNVETFVRLLENSGDIVAQRRGEWEIVLRKSR